MPSQQLIQRRLRSVAGTRQLTRAMYLVAASKLRRAQAAATAPREYVTATADLLARVQSQAPVAAHPLYVQRPAHRILTIIIAADRGLAGAYHASLLRQFQRHLKEIQGQHQSIVVGRSLGARLATITEAKELAAYHMDLPDPETQIVDPILTEVTDLFSVGQIDAVYLIHTRFLSVIRQEATTTRLLPVAAAPAQETATPITLEPDAETLLQAATTRHLRAQLIHAVLDARASEQAARMLAMQNATNNAQELTEDLTLELNNARQAAITQELAEITAGAEAT